MIKFFFYIAFLLFAVQSCATFQPQYSKDYKEETFPTDKKPVHTFFLLGDAGLGLVKDTVNRSNALVDHLNAAPENSTLMFLGDNIYPAGMPEENDENRKDAEQNIQNQIDLAASFKGKTLFIPGNHDWYSNGVEGLKREQIFVEQQLGKKSFLPKNGCPIDKVKISDDVVLLTVDSQWYITNWDRQPTINDDCDIKTRADFLDEFRDEIKKARGKTTIVALHHPVFTNGSHGGQYSFKSHMTPAPLVGSLKNLLRETTGISNTDIENKFYNELSKYLVAAAQQNDKVIFVSGHDHNLQYIINDQIPQIISGSGSKLNPTRNVKGGQFSYGVNGYGILDVFEDGSSFLRFIDSNNGKTVYQQQVLKPDNTKRQFNFDPQFPAEMKSSVYDPKATEKSSAYQFLWGKRYRESYGIPVTAETADLETLFGGLKPIRKGGGNQSKTLRLETKDGKQYVMRAVKKNATQYLQSLLFKDQYIEPQFKNTATEKLVMDVFTGSYPFAPLVIPALSDPIGIYHLNPKLYYIPKQKALAEYNSEFGDELYIIEEQASEGNLALKEKNFTGNIISTTDVLKKLHSDESFAIDEPVYIRSRLFDMLINDWDRHQDQWRWLEFKENGKTIYKALPRDRDQSFSKMSNGLIMGAATEFFPAAELLKKYNADLKNVKGFNVEPYPLDMALIRTSDKKVWDEQVRLIQNNLTDEVIEKAFNQIPKEAQNESVAFIKKTLKARKENLQKISDDYFKVINKYGVITGTNKDDLVKIENHENGNVELSLFRKKKDSTDLFLHKIYDPKLTKEIWVYGLDDDDTFEVTGTTKKIKIRLIGGQNKDEFKVEDGRKVYIYDYKSKNNNIDQAKNTSVKLSDEYNLNTYDYRKLKTNTTETSVLVGANPDDGFKAGANLIFTSYGFERNPFTAKHHFKGAFYFATSGYELSYKGEFANVIGHMNLLIESNFQSANFTQNFFGYGNETKNLEKSLGEDYHRVRIKEYDIAPSLVYRAFGGAQVAFGASYKAVEVDKTAGRFVANTDEIPSSVFESNQFAGVHSTFEFENYDNKVFPTIGMKTAVEVGFKTSLEDTKRNFIYLIPEVSFTHRLISSGKLVVATQIKSHLIFNDHFEFYQAASIGGNDGLRGFRKQRFSGQKALFQNTDLRYTFNSMKTNIIPIKLGVYGGFDYGRIWLKGEDSDKWNNSYGGGIFVNGADLLSANLGLFKSIDGLRLAFSLGFQF